MESLERILGEHPFFEGLEPVYLQLVVGCASNVKFEAGEFIFREGGEATRCYLLRHGRATLETFVPGAGPVIIQTLDAGDVLGWSWLIPPHNWRFDARALDLVRAIALDGKCLRQKAEEDSAFGYRLLKRVTGLMEQRLQATRMQLLDVYRK